MVRRNLLVLAIVFASFSFVGCAGDEQEVQEEQPPPATRQGETDGRTTTDGNGEATVGGFAVEGPGGEEETIPRVSADREATREYVEQVRPIVEDTARDVSGLARPEVRAENGSSRWTWTQSPCEGQGTRCEGAWNGCARSTSPKASSP